MMKITAIREQTRHEAGTYISWCVLILAAVVVAYFCCTVTVLDDDLCYQYNHAKGPLAEFNHVWEILQSQYAHYFFVNGRFVDHCIVQLFDGFLGQRVFAIFNGIVYILFLRITMLHIGISTSNWRGTTTLTCLVLMFLGTRMTPAFQMYIWMYLLVLVYLWIFLHFHTKRWWLIAILGLFSVVCGNAHESLNAGVTIALIIYCTAHFRRISTMQWVMSACFALGAFAIVASPGTGERMDSTVGFILEYRVIGLYLMLQPINMLHIIAAVLLYRTLIRHDSLREIFRHSEIWWLIWAGQMGATLWYGFPGGRCMMGEELMAIILTMRMLRNRRFTTFWLALLVAAELAVLALQWQFTRRINTYMKEVERQWIEHPHGLVYIDTDNSSPIPEWLRYSPQLPVYNPLHLKVLAAEFTKRHGICKPIRLLPTALRPYIEGDAYAHRSNAIIPTIPGSYLIISSKESPAKFYVTYRRDLPFFEKEYPPMPLSPSEIIYANDKFNAFIVKDIPEFPAIRTSATYSMESPATGASD